MLSPDHQEKGPQIDFQPNDLAVTIALVQSGEQVSDVRLANIERANAVFTQLEKDGEAAARFNVVANLFYKLVLQEKLEKPSSMNAAEFAQSKIAEYKRALEMIKSGEMIDPSDPLLREMRLVFNTMGSTAEAKTLKAILEAQALVTEDFMGHS